MIPHTGAISALENGAFGSFFSRIILMLLSVFFDVVRLNTDCQLTWLQAMRKGREKSNGRPNLEANHMHTTGKL
ncbi:hypothetical protein PspLS_08424 [Pyricularia sp. CBS 133598]|nr:hypothetical protein PspLS_08424 [Pyricularia sp. CBS 133598]